MIHICHQQVTAFFILFPSLSRNPGFRRPAARPIAFAPTGFAARCCAVPPAAAAAAPGASQHLLLLGNQRACMIVKRISFDTFIFWNLSYIIFDAVFGFAFILTADHQEFKIRRSSHMRAIGISRAQTSFPTGYQSLFMSLPQNLIMFPYLQVKLILWLRLKLWNSYSKPPSSDISVSIQQIVRSITLFFVGFTCHKCHYPLVN